jgi:hypothetical protein
MEEVTMTTKRTINTNSAALGQHIDAALTAPDMTSTELGTLLEEVGASITQADENAAAEREKALRLQARLREVENAEQAAEWQADYKQVETQCDELATEFAESYPTLVQQLVDLFQRMAKMR